MRPAVKRTIQSALSLLVIAIVLAGCAATHGAESNMQYDLGPLTPASQAHAAWAAKARSNVPALVVTDANGLQVLDNQAMLYRLLYADPLQARTYANNRWSAPPLQLLTQRFKSRIAQAGIKVLNVTDATGNVLLLRVDVDDFSQNFDTPSQNHGQLLLRASVFLGHTLIDQKTFSARAASTSADAAGGARALASTADTVADELVAWLATLPPRP